MRILRVLPILVGLGLAGLASVPASADTVFEFKGKSSYSDSISAPSKRFASRSNVGAMRSDAADDDDDDTPRVARRNARQEKRRAGRSSKARKQIISEERRSSRRGRTRTASLGGEYASGGGSHGVASFYWQPQRVASGGWFNPNAMTAAHKTLPFGTRVRVTHATNGRSVVVTINDRGPYIRGRTIDLSKAAAGVIGMLGQGVARIRMEVLGR